MRQSLLTGLAVVALVTLACNAANLNRSGDEGYIQEAESSVDQVTERTYEDASNEVEGVEEATVEDASTYTDPTESGAAASPAAAVKPTFFYAAQAANSAEDEDAKDEEASDSEDDELESLMDEIMMAEELEGRSAIWMDPYLPEYEQGRLNQLGGGYSMALQTPYPDFGVHGPPPPPSVAAGYDRHAQGFYPSYATASPHHPAVGGYGVCPPCACGYEDDDSGYLEDDNQYYEEDHDEYYEDDEDDVTVPYGFVFDPTIRHERSRKRRSVDDYWYSVGEPSKHLAKHNVGYRIKNDLRKRLEDESVYPLHYGHIYTGGLEGKSVHDRPFGYDADFDLYQDSHAFKLKPHGPRLGKKWARQGYPVYAYNLYKLRGSLKGQEINKDGKKKDVWIKPGIYRFFAILDDLAGLMIEEVKSGKRFIVRDIMKNKRQLSKFQALLPFKDPNAKYVSVKNKTLGLVYLVKATPLAGTNPKVKSDLLHHGFSNFKKQVRHHGSLINNHNVIKGTPNFKFH